jgi:AsmA protein
MVRAQDVSAAIRLRPLFRGHLEIATLSATEPSINLVRNDQGRWNLASLIERSSRIPAAPTGKAASERRPGFPYLEASRARINFKIGQAKKSWALTDADAALWQEGENSWGARLKAQPVRTDFNLTDTGVVRLDATWQRSPNLAETPLQVSLEWQQGQLGQITKLFTGGDRGWRGGVSLGAILSGTPKALLVRSQIRIDDFRRYDILSSGVRLATECSGQYSAADSLLENLACESPVSGGTLRLSGSLSPMKTEPTYDLTFSAEKVPLSSLLQLVRQTQKGLPADLTATGRLSAEVHSVNSNTGSTGWSGEGSVADVRLSSNGGKDEITFGDIPLAVRSGSSKYARGEKAHSGIIDSEPGEAHFSVGPIALPMGAPMPANVAGWVSSSGYSFSVSGDTGINNLYRLANTLGVSGFRPVAQGSAHLDVGFMGPWQGLAGPQVVGTAQLRNVQTGMRGLNPPIDISSATVTLDPETVSLEKIAAQTGDTHWTGAVRAPRHCGVDGCVFQFDLTADQLSSSGLTEWFTLRPAKRPWYRILSSREQQGKSPFVAIQARGKVRINRMRLAKVEASQIVAQVDLDRGKIVLSKLRAQLFQGTHQGDWAIDLSAMPPHYQVSGQLQNVSMSQVSAAMNDSWATGTVDGKFSLTAYGSKFPDLMAHAEAELQFGLRNGSFAHIDLPEASKPFPVRAFSGNLRVKDGTWKLSAGKLESHDGIYQLSGTASAGGGLNLLLTRGDEQSWNVTGTLLKPTVERANHINSTEARTVVKP